MRSCDTSGSAVWGKRLYIARGRGNVQIYSLNGTFERSFELNATKEYFTLIDGVDKDRSIVVGDTEGNVWLANASGRGVPRPIDRDWDIERKPLARLIPSPSGHVVVLLHTEIPQPPPLVDEPVVSGAVGHASVWWIGMTGPESTLDLKHEGSVLDIAVSPSKEADLVVTAGADGQAGTLADHEEESASHRCVRPRRQAGRLCDVFRFGRPGAHGDPGRSAAALASPSARADATAIAAGLDPVTR